jgi:hypothetical protein
VGRLCSGNRDELPNSSYGGAGGGQEVVSHHQEADISGVFSWRIVNTTTIRMSDSKPTSTGSSTCCPTLSGGAVDGEDLGVPTGDGGLPDDPEETRVTCSVLCSLGGGIAAVAAAAAGTTTTTTTTSYSASAMSPANSTSSAVQDDDMTHEQQAPKSCTKRICPKQHQLPMFLSSKCC